MNMNKIHTPEGTGDLIGSEYSTKRHIERAFEHRFALYGYLPVQSPTFEFLDVFENTQGASEGMIKFFDAKGRILALRPDYTPAIARMAATRLSGQPMPLRLSYIGKAYSNDEAYADFKQKEFSQAGIECIGDDSAIADAEVIAMTVECLKEVGLRDFQIEIGHADFFSGIARQCGLSEADIQILRSYLYRKDSFGIERLLEKNGISGDLYKLITALPTLFGEIDVLEKAKYPQLNETSLHALMQLSHLYQILTEYGVENYISIDLGLTNQHEYYTGAIFKGFARNVGFSICAGGRYDTLLQQYGKGSPAVGMALYTDRILAALIRSGSEVAPIGPETIICFSEDCRQKAIDCAKKLRACGTKTALMHDVDLSEAKSRGAKRLILITENAQDCIDCEGEADCT